MSARLVTPTRRRCPFSAHALRCLDLPGLGWRPARAPGEASLRLLETTDIHVHLYPYDYYRDREDDTVGLARIATLVRKARGEEK